MATEPTAPYLVKNTGGKCGKLTSELALGLHIRWPSSAVPSLGPRVLSRGRRFLAAAALAGFVLSPSAALARPGGGGSYHGGGGGGYHGGGGVGPGGVGGN